MMGILKEELERILEEDLKEGLKEGLKRALKEKVEGLEREVEVEEGGVFKTKPGVAEWILDGGKRTRNEERTENYIGMKKKKPEGAADEGKQIW